nr:unnamed protein product [Callosobruchus chinensis]
MDEIEIMTSGQDINEKWKEMKRDYLTASNFGKVIRRRSATPCRNLLKQLLCRTEPDRRGKGQIHRRMDNDKRVSVITHIKKFPRYRSHYSRKANGQTKYISSDLSMKIIFIFNTEFNLRFHRPHSDNCSRCDSYQNILKYPTEIDEAKITKTKNLLALHQKRAKKAIEMKKDDIEKYRHSTNTIVVCFDLQQALPTLLLTTSKGLPGNRVLINKICLPPNITRIIAYSDSCSGQNKN